MINKLYFEFSDVNKSCATDNSLTIGLSIAGVLVVLFLLFLIASEIWTVKRPKQIDRSPKIEENSIFNKGSGTAALANNYATPQVVHDKKKKAFDRKMAQFNELKDLPRFEKDQIHVGKILGKLRTMYTITPLGLEIEFIYIDK